MQRIINAQKTSKTFQHTTYRNTSLNPNLSTKVTEMPISKSYQKHVILCTAKLNAEQINCRYEATKRRLFVAKRPLKVPMLTCVAVKTTCRVDRAP